MNDKERPEEPRRVRVHDKRAGADAPVDGSPPHAGAPEDPHPSGRPAPEEAQVTSEQISAELDEATRLAADRLDQLMRLKADYENFRKRTIREQTEIVSRASLRVVENLLPVLDNFELAIAAAKDHAGDDSRLLKGVDLVFRQLHDVLSAEGLERVEAEGQPFDPHEHEAMASQPAPVGEPTVLEVVRPGYRLAGRTVRPALVKVGTPDGSIDAGDEADETPPAEEG